MMIAAQLTSAQDVIIVVAVILGIVCLAATIGISCTHYYGLDKREKTKQAAEKTRQIQIEGETAKAKYTDRQINGPSGEDIMARVDAEEKVAKAVDKQTGAYTRQAEVLERLNKAEKERRDLFDIK